MEQLNEPETIRKDTLNKDIGVRKNSECSKQANESKAKVSQSANKNKASQKNDNPIEKIDEVVIKEEVIEESVYDVIEISDDEDIEETKDVLKVYDVIKISDDEDLEESKDVVKVYDRKEAGNQVKVDNKNENFCSKSNETSSSQGAGPMIKVRSPEAINELLMKSLNSSSSAPESKKRHICVVPKYPMSPKYPPNVPKPPAPRLQGHHVYSNIETNEYIMLSWSFRRKNPENIVEYQLFAYQERSVKNSSKFVWQKVGDIKAIPLPMACSITRYVEGETYYFMIRAVDSQKRLGDFSIPVRIKPQKIPASRKTPAGTLLKAPLPNNKI